MAEMGTSAVWHDADKSWEMRELPLPELESDAIQIRVKATSVCGSDLHIWRGDGQPPLAQIGLQLAFLEHFPNNVATTDKLAFDI